MYTDDKLSAEFEDKFNSETDNNLDDFYQIDKKLEETCPHCGGIFEAQRLINFEKSL